MEMGKRTPVLRRKTDPVVEVEVTAPAKPRPKPFPKSPSRMATEPEPEPEMETITCPKCGAELADTPENREYAASKMESEDGEYADAGEGAESEDEMED